MSNEYERIRREQADWFRLNEALGRSAQQQAQTREPRDLNERIPERKATRKAEVEMWMDASQRQCHVRFRGSELLDETGKRADVSDTLDRFRDKSAFEYFELVAANFRRFF